MAARRDGDRSNVYLVAGRQIRRLRLEAGLTQGALAERSGLSTPFVSFLESGRKQGSLASYDRLAAALGVPIASLFEAGQNRQPWARNPLPGLSAGERRTVWRLVQTLRRKS